MTMDGGSNSVRGCRPAAFVGRGARATSSYTAAASATVVVNVEAIPTLGDVALLLLCSLLLFSGTQRLRRRRSEVVSRAEYSTAP